MLPPPGGELLEPLLGWPVPIAGRWSRRVRINVRFSRRGRRVLEPGRLVIRDPLADVRARGGRAQGEGEVLVLPRIEPVTAPGGGGAGAGDRGRASARRPASRARRLDASTAELEIDGLRPYREGSPASRIHWPTVARRGEMVERRLVAELDSAPLVVLDCSAPASEEALDAAVRAAGLALRPPGPRERLRAPAARATGARSRSGPTWAPGPSVHVRLALVEPGRRRPRRPWLRAAARCSGSPPPTSRPRRARSSGCPPRRASWSARTRRRGAPVAFEVAGCSGCRLGRGRAEGGRVSGALAQPLPRGARHRRGRGRPRGRPQPARDSAAAAPGLLRRARRLRRRPLGRRSWTTRRWAGRSLRWPSVTAGAAVLGAARPRAAAARRRVLALARARHASRCSWPRSGAAGLPLRLLAPARLGRARRRARPRPRGRPDRRLALRGAGRVDPADDPARRAALLAVAAALAFFPVAQRRARAAGWAALVLLLVLYGTAVTEHDPGAPLLRGFVLLVLVGAWLWLPRLAAREAARGGRRGRVGGDPRRARGRGASTPSGPGGTTATGSGSATAGR